MRKVFKDLTGERFGQLVVIGVVRKSNRKHGPSIWRCLCDCGKETSVQLPNLRSGQRSCGCAKATQGGMRYKARQHPMGSRWKSMLDRCAKPYHKDFKNYGGRGITVCERWKFLPNFVADMGPTFFEGASIERKDNNAGYSPENCVWATQREQTNNRRITLFVDSPWERIPISEAAERSGVSYQTLKWRVRAGWSQDRLFKPTRD
jgi:hypothetical protein